MSDTEKVWWSVCVGLVLWIAVLCASVFFPGCSRTSIIEEYTKFPEGKYVRLQCYSPQGMVTGVVPREKLEQRIRLFDMPCILEGIDELPPPPIATAEPQPQASPTKVRK